MLQPCRRGGKREGEEDQQKITEQDIKTGSDLGKVSQRVNSVNAQLFWSLIQRFPTACGSARNLSFRPKLARVLSR